MRRLWKRRKPLEGFGFVTNDDRITLQGELDKVIAATLKCTVISDLSPLWRNGPSGAYTYTFAPVSEAWMDEFAEALRKAA